MGCPFGYRGQATEQAPADDADGSDVDCCEDARHAQAPRSAAEKDPVHWFFQNQIRCEQEFQANKSKLREEARHQLDSIFRNKNKRLIVDSDEDFSINSDELSAWDSDVHSLASMVSCANSWAEERQFAAPAARGLKAGLAALLAAGGYGAWAAASAWQELGPYGGILFRAWLPSAAMAVSLAAAAAALACWASLGYRSKRTLLGFQLALQTLYGAATGVAVVAWLSPAQVDWEVQGAACTRFAGSQDSSRLCRRLPDVDTLVASHMGAILMSTASQAAALLLCLLGSTWTMWELGIVAQKALKHKRRRRQRKRSIPWDKIKVEDLGPMMMCGGGGGGPTGARAAKPAQQAGAAGGGCPFGYKAAAQATGAKKDS